MAKITNDPMERRTLGVSNLPGKDVNSENSWKVAIPWIEKSSADPGDIRRFICAANSQIVAGLWPSAA
jgi:hypothetical protein